MTCILSLWLPILLSAVLVFVASSVIHMLLAYHVGDAGPVPEQEKAADALRGLEIPPGDYAIPRASSMKEMNTPEFAEQLKRGPVVFLTVLPNGPLAVGKSLGQWFVYCLVVGAVAGYTAGLTLGRRPSTGSSSASSASWPSPATRWRFRRAPSGGTGAGASPC